MIRAVAQAIFGNPDKVQYKAITDAQRIPDILNGSVDIVAAHDDDHLRPPAAGRLLQRLLRRPPAGAGPRRARRRRPAWPASAARRCARRAAPTRSTTIEELPATRSRRPGAVLDRLPGPAAAGPGGGHLHRRHDPGRARRRRTRSPGSSGPELTDEPYGLAISKQHPDFVRFVNAVLAQERADGAWVASYHRWVGPQDVVPPPARYSARAKARSGSDAGSGAHGGRPRSRAAAQAFWARPEPHAPRGRTAGARPLRRPATRPTAPGYCIQRQVNTL